MKSDFLFGFGLGMVFNNVLLKLYENRKKNNEISIRTKSEKINTNY
jgi:hypothetical protein